MGYFVPSTATCTWPTNTATTTEEILSVPMKLPSTLNVPKPSASNQASKSWPGPHTPVPLLSPVHSDWSTEEDVDGTKQKDQQRKIADERRKKREEVNAQLCLP